MASDGQEAACLQGAKQAVLRLMGKRPDPVEEQRPFMGELELSLHVVRPAGPPARPNSSAAARSDGRAGRNLDEGFLGPRTA